MATDGHVDFEGEAFLARVDEDPDVVAKLEQIQRCRWATDQSAWLIAAHWPSVRQLLHIALELGWTISAEARQAIDSVRQEGESLAYFLDVVHGSYGEAWFVCEVGDDDVLRHRISELPGAYWEDGWRIPTDWEQCCIPLLEIVQPDLRFEVSAAAWRLLQEADASHEFVRSSAPEAPEPASAPEAPPSGATRKPRVTTADVQRSVAPARTRREAS